MIIQLQYTKRLKGGLCIMANKKNSKKNSKKKNAPKVTKIKEQKIQETEAEVVEAAEAKEPEAIETPEVIEAPAEVQEPEAAEAAEVVEAAVEEPEVVEAAAPEPVEVPVAEEPAAEGSEDAAPESPAEVTEVAAPEADAVIEVQEPEVVEEAIETPAEVTENVASEAPAEASEVTDFTLVMNPVNEDAGKAADPAADMNAAAAAGTVHPTPEEARLEAEYAAARAEVPPATTAITPVVPVTGYGDDAANAKKAVKVKAPKESKFKGLLDKPVTRKFLAAALGLTLVLNGLIAAGIMALFANDLEDDIIDVKKSVKGIESDISELQDQSGQSGNFGNGGPGMGMTPPDWGGNNDFGRGSYDDDWDDWYNNGDDDNDDSAWGSQQNGLQDQQNGQNSQNDQNDQYGSQSSAGPSIGIVISDNNGVYISQVTGTNAQKAGFKEGDKIISIDGDDVDDSNELISEVREHKSGDKVTVVVERDGKEVKITTTLE